MKKTVAVITLAVLVLFLTIKVSSRAWAATPQPTGQEGKGCGAPKEWGQLKGVADRAVAFEDSSGNIRVLDLGPCMRGQTELIVTINRP
ncbi:MAG TPA: hypothetical protein VGG14_09165 [Candidatus Sulfotelmatobacter sp.]|jgi:hypothetical protein